MAALIISAAAVADLEAIDDYLAAKAGSRVADKYAALFDQLFVEFCGYPESGARRPHLGKNTRLGIVAPYNIYCDFESTADVLTILRILHGRRKITRRLLQPDF